MSVISVPTAHYFGSHNYFKRKPFINNSSRPWRNSSCKHCRRSNKWQCSYLLKDEITWSHGYWRKKERERENKEQSMSMYTHSHTHSFHLWKSYSCSQYCLARLQLTTKHVFSVTKEITLHLNFEESSADLKCFHWLVKQESKSCFRNQNWSYLEYKSRNVVKEKL